MRDVDSLCTQRIRIKILVGTSLMECLEKWFENCLFVRWFYSSVLISIRQNISFFEWFIYDMNVVENEHFMDIQRRKKVQLNWNRLLKYAPSAAFAITTKKRRKKNCISGKDKSNNSNKKNHNDVVIGWTMKRYCIKI